MIDQHKFKQLEKLSTHKGRLDEGAFLIESPFIVREALKNPDLMGMEIFATKSWLEEFPMAEEISDAQAEVLSDSYSPQEVFAMIGLPSQHNLEEKLTEGKWIILDGVQDPGNVGTIIRTANGAGFTGVIVSSRVADIHSPKVLRAMKGANFHLPILEMDLVTAISTLKEKGVRVYGSLLDENAQDYRMVSAQENFALILGNEGQGMSKELAKLTDDNLYIPMNQGQESLNVAIAGALLMYRLAQG